MKKIFLNEILVVESLKDYLKISTLTNKYIIHSTLSDFTSLLPERDFIRIHRSYTIAIDKNGAAFDKSGSIIKSFPCNAPGSTRQVFFALST